MKSGIYILVNLINNMYYIGQTFDFDRRWKNHISRLIANKHPNQYLQNAWNKYGRDNFKFYVLEWISDKSMLTPREQFWLDRSRCYEKEIGYNLSPSAGSNNSGIKRSQETRAKMSAWQIGKTYSDETKKKMSDVKKGKKSSEETKKKLSLITKERWTGRKHTEEAKIKMRKPKSEETKRKLSVAVKLYFNNRVRGCIAGVRQL